MTAPESAPFRTIPRSAQVACVTCGRKGYGDVAPPPGTALPWQRQCIRGHPFACECGRVFSTKTALSAHRSHHPKEPK